MKHSFISWLLAPALLLGGSARLFAWPFAENHNLPILVKLITNFETDPPLYPCHSNASPFIDLAAGDRVIVQNSPFSQDVKFLPMPDKDPYPASSSEVGTRNDYSVAGDVNGDGHTDIVRTCNLSYQGDGEPHFRILTYLNDGQGNHSIAWQWKKTIAGKNMEPQPTVLADLDGDGDLDLLEGIEGLRVRWNPGNGNYNIGQILDSSLLRIFSIKLADLNGDGWQDIVVLGNWTAPDPENPGSTSSQRLIRTFIAKGNGLFHPPVTNTFGSGSNTGVTQIEVMDVDRDGRQDILAATSSWSSGGISRIAWLRWNGTNLANPADILTGDHTNRFHFTVGDMDEDGHDDIVFARAAGMIEWLRSTGASTFASPAVLAGSHPGGTTNPRRITLVDLDGDGDLDIHWDGGRKFIENLSITLEPAAQAVPWSGTEPGPGATLATGDLNGDGRPDLVVADPANKRILWYAATSYSFSGNPSVINLGIQTPNQVVVADFNRDGRNDIAWTNGSEVRVALNSSGNGSTWYHVAAGSLSGSSCLAVSDIDGDGDPDLVAGSASGSGTIRTYINQGDGIQWDSEFVVSGVPGIARIGTAQTSPGGRPEIHLVFNPPNGNGGWREYRHGASGWLPLNSVNVPTGQSAGLLLANLHGSHLTNAAFCIGTGNGIRVPGGNQIASSGAVARQLRSADWNRNGVADILQAHSQGIDILARGSNQPATWKRTPLIAGIDFSDIVVVDYNQDGLPDAIAVESGTGKLYLIRNTSVEVTLDHTVHGTGQAPLRLAPGNSGHAMTVHARHPGRPAGGKSLGEADAVPATVQLRFRRAVASGDSWVPGTAMTEAEVAAVVQHVGVGGAEAVPSPVSLGRFAMNLPAEVPLQLSVPGGGSRDIPIAVKLKPTAAAAPVTRFYIEHLAGGIADATRWNPRVPSGSPPLRNLASGSVQAAPAALIEVFTPGHLDHWRMTHFGTHQNAGDAANDADPDGDGVPNLVEYLMGRDPNGSSEIGGRTPPVAMIRQNDHSPVVAELRLLAQPDPKVRVAVQQSQDLKSWTTLGTRTGDGPWTGVQPTAVNLAGGRTRFNFTTPAAPVSTPRYFLRLTSEELP